MNSVCVNARSKRHKVAVAEPSSTGRLSVPRNAQRGFMVAVIVAATTVAGGGLAQAYPSEGPSCSAADTSHGPPSASIPPDLQPNFECKSPYVPQGHPIKKKWQCVASVGAGALGIQGSWSARQIMKKGKHFATRWVPGLGEAAAVYGGYSAYHDCK